MTTEYLYVDGRDTTYQEWTRSGTTPYLNAIDSNYIYSATNNKKEGYFSFADTANTPTACTVDIYAKGTYDEDLMTYGAVRIYLYDGSTWTNVGTVTLTQDTYKWYTVNCFTKLGTQAKVNAAQMYLMSIVAGAESANVDCARLTITYSGLIPISVAGSTVASGSLLRNKELTILGSTVGAGGLLNDKNLARNGTIHGTGITAIFKTLAKIEVSGNITTLGSIKVNKTMIINGNIVATGTSLTDKTLTVQGLINALGNVTIAEIINDINILGNVLSQGSITINKTITIQGLIHTLGSIELVGPPTPTVTPTTPAGFVAHHAIQKLIITVNGQVLLDFKSFLMTLDGQIFLNLNGVYVSLDKQVLINLNKNKPVYMIIN